MWFGSLEASVIHGDLKGNFTLSGVENSLRSHWTDDQVKRRDGEAKHVAHYQDEEDDINDPAEDLDEAFFENWSDQEVAWYQDARAQEHEAWLQYQQAKRTLRDARARQQEVKMGRRFYKPSWQKGNGKGKQPIGASPSASPCLKCGSRSHRTSDCPQAREESKGMRAEELAEFTYFHEDSQVYDNDHQHDDNQVSAEQHEPMDTEVHEIFSAWDGQKRSTDQAIQEGMAVLDSGATRTMGSAHAVEQLLS